MSYQKLIDFWGFDNLSRAKPEALKSINISEESKHFLVEIGLPRELDLFYPIKFSLEYDIFPELEIKKYLSKKIYQKYSQLKQTIIIASEDNILGYFCIFEFTGGFVYSIGIDKGVIDGIYFMNSSVQQLAEFLFLYQNYRLKGERENIFDDEDKYYHLTQELEYEMYQVDARVFDNEENWWLLVLEQMYDGLI